MSRTLAGVLAGMFLLAFACGAVAGIPDPDESSVDLTDDSGAGMATCPDFDGLAYSSVKVTALRSNLSPIEGIPYNSFFFLVTGGDVNFSHTTDETDVNGEIFFDVDDNECIVGDVTIEGQIYTVVLNDSDLLSCNCYDINQDGGVGAQDFALWLSVYGTTDSSGDFNWDGGVGAQDFALWLSHYGHGL
jgi:hypothetical protein